MKIVDVPVTYRGLNIKRSEKRVLKFCFGFFNGSTKVKASISQGLQTLE